MEDGSIILSPTIRSALEVVVLGLLMSIGTAITAVFAQLTSWLRSRTSSDALRSASEELDKVIEDTVRKGSSRLFSEFRLAAEDGKITRSELSAIVSSAAEEVRTQLGTKGIESIQKRLGGLDTEAMASILSTRIEAGLNKLVTKVTFKSAIELDVPGGEHSTTLELPPAESESK